MDFTFTDEQQMLKDAADRFGLDNWAAADRLKRLEEGRAGAQRRWREMAEMGWLMLAIPEAEGGIGGSPIDVMALTEGFGRHLMTDPFVSGCVLAPALLAGGGDKASERLSEIGAGEVMVAAALIEPYGDHDLSWVATRADTSGGTVRLSGAKSHVEDGAYADWFIVSARTGGADGEADGIGLFLVAKDAEGLSVDRFRAMDHHFHARLTLDGVAAIPILSDGALPRIEQAVDHAICAHLAEATGSMEAAAAATLDYLRTRHQFGVAIGSFQVLQHRMVDMTIACEEGRSMAYHATLNLHADALTRRRAVSAGKTRVADCGIYVGQQAVQLHGGVGFSDELIVSHHLKRQMMIDLAHGPAAFHRALFANAA
jgi:pimeloyl-CoA dehydrogenase